MTTILDTWIILFVVASVIRGRTAMWGLFLLLIAYLMTRILPAVYTDAPLEDFAQAYRWLLYLIAFSVAVGREWGPVQPLVRLMWFLLTMSLLKGAVTYVVVPGDRPGLMLENNFELPMFAGLVAVLYPHIGRRRWLAVVLLGGATLLSGSRSGSLAFAVLAVYALSQVPMKNIAIRYFTLIAVPIMLAIPLWIFSERAANSTQLDRLNFLEVFLAETSQWGPVEWMFGTTPITPLSAGACFRLSYYQSLFSSEGDGSCYSVILHAFLMRVVFDAGILGASIAFGVAWFTMRRASVRASLALTLIGIAISNSVSVSGLNNPYVAFPILLAILVAGKMKAAVGADLYDRLRSSASKRHTTAPDALYQQHPS
ncbi:hypothetical protein MRBLWH7_002009 [Microbacterium sp. LWH7-1.2]